MNTCQHNFCYTILLSTVDPQTEKGEVIKIKNGETGYYKTSFVLDNNGVGNLNDELGVSLNESLAMYDCSIFDYWKNYENILEKYNSL